VKISPLLNHDLYFDITLYVLIFSYQ
jgi:hypothetical protein